MRGSKPARLVAALVGAVMVAAALFGIRQWTLNDEAGSLALFTIAATLALALAGTLAYGQNAALVSAAIDEAKASADQAQATSETVEEMRRQRELSYRPWLVYAGVRFDPGSSSATVRVMPSQKFVLKNIGTGPAVNVCLAVTRTTAEGKRLFQAHEVGGIAAGDHWEVVSLYLEDNAPMAGRPDRYRCLTDDLGINEVGEVVAVRYEDWFGNHYRSPGSVFDPRPALWAGDGSLADAPDWMRCS